MERVHPNPRRLWLVAAAPLVAVAILGCNATSAPTPAPAATMSAKAAFIARITAADFQVSGHLTGTTTYALGSVSETLQMTGSFSIDGADNSWTIDETVNGQSIKVADVTVGGSTYDLGSNGDWIDYGAPPGNVAVGPSTLIQNISVVDKGPAFFGDQQVHLFSSDNRVDPLAIYLTSDVQSSDLHLEFWVKNDGTPVGMTVSGSWNQLAGETTVSPKVDIDFTFDSFTGVAISAPSVAPGSQSPESSGSPAASKG